MRPSFTQSGQCCKALLAFFLGTLGHLHADDWRIAIDHAKSLHSEGRLTEARKTLLSALPQAGQHQDGTWRLAYTFGHLAWIAQDERQFLDAERYYRRSIALWREGGSASAVGLAQTMNNLSSLLNDLGKLKEAYELLRESEAIQLERNDPGMAVILMNRGSIYFRWRKYREAEETFRRAWQILQPAEGPAELNLARVANDLGLVCEKTDRKDEAQSYFALAQRIWEGRVQAGNATPQILVDLAASYLEGRQERRAISLLENGLAVTPFESGARMHMLSLYAMALRRSGRNAEAALTEKQVQDIRTRSQEGLAKHTVGFRELQGKER